MLKAFSVMATIIAVACMVLMVDAASTNTDRWLVLGGYLCGFVYGCVIAAVTELSRR